MPMVRQSCLCHTVTSHHSRDFCVCMQVCVCVYMLPISETLFTYTKTSDTGLRISSSIASLHCFLRHGLSLKKEFANLVIKFTESCLHVPPCGGIIDRTGTIGFYVGAKDLDFSLCIFQQDPYSLSHLSHSHCFCCWVDIDVSSS